jgi:hypothetical protein
LQAGVGAGLPLGIATTYGGLDTSDGSAWNQLARFPIERVFVECYKDDDPVHADIARMLHQGEVYGIPASLLRAVCGTYRGELPSDYLGLTKDNYGGIYNIPQTTDAQLDKWETLNLTVSAPAVVIPDPAIIRQQASAKLHEWLDPYMAQSPPKPQNLSIIRLADRLLKLTGTQQADFSEQLLVNELDRVGSPRS